MHYKCEQPCVIIISYFDAIGNVCADKGQSRRPVFFEVVARHNAKFIVPHIAVVFSLCHSPISHHTQYVCVCVSVCVCDYKAYSNEHEFGPTKSAS